MKSTKIAIKRGRGLWSDAWDRLRENRLAMVCLGIVIVFASAAIFGSVVYWRYNMADAEVPAWLAPLHSRVAEWTGADELQGKVAPYDAKNMDIQFRAPGWIEYEDVKGVKHREFHLMGTDGLGRDVFLRLLQGARIAFQVGVITSLIAIALGVVLGCLAGFFGGWVDDLIVWVYSTFASMPTLLFVLSISLIVGRGLFGVYLGIGLTTWVRICRLVRGEIMKHKELTYVRAARALGLSRMRIIFRHIMPNLMHIIIISFSLGFPAAIETEVIMSFLGIGVQSEPSWGIMIGSGRMRLWHGVWWEFAFTTGAIFMTVLAFNLLGDALRDALDPRLRSGQKAE